ncbi:divergent polysaccharide deacetylase family protein [Campylobacter sp. RM9344]|uniref:Divergent polysaccharide deacetylase family protein n=1 Tax=Campylobacter californiensis TaxID=1032243 RepID=A0AAW3ZUM1_9BACT|nr:divergent polysaccharide deacetylase family protein [Campylobacter sp. RM9337]MBE3029602.1 divergent polysaccharide deacetylase family protein [Campylobacter sp. RM9344]MBE3608322.1 divergent polysaccharide deacetylase family protein [Campylobacter sp. RM9337]
MNKKKTTKGRSKKSLKGRPLNKTFLGIALLSLLIIITLIVVLNQKSDKTADINQTTINVKNVTTITDKRVEDIKKPVQKQHKVAKFDEDENLTKIFIDPKNKDEIFKNQKPQIYQKQKDETEVNASIKHEIKDVEKDTKKESPVKTQDKFNEDNVSKKIPQEKIQEKQISKKDENKTAKQATQSDKKPLPKEEAFVPLTPTKSLFGKPKLVIIIDDVATFEHVNMIRSTGLKLTPSIFPATKAHPDTPKIAQGFEFFMIHLPMQAKNFKRPEIGTLNVTDSYESMLERVKKIRADFPKAVYINNHTGSKFTSNFDAMDRAYRALLSQNFVFVDSRTIGTSVVAKVASKYSKPYISRDVFLDDDPSRSAVKRELENAVRIAKKRSYAIAIGHPKKNTIDIIKESKNTILKDVEVVYLKEIL